MGKYNEFSNFILDFDIICLQETWLKPKDITEIGGYEILRNDRLDIIGGGTAILCRSALDPCLLNISSMDRRLFEFSLCVVNRVRLHNKPLLIVSIYKPPSIRIGFKRWHSFVRSLENLTMNYSVCICGDLNAQHFA